VTLDTKKAVKGRGQAKEAGGSNGAVRRPQAPASREVMTIEEAFRRISGRRGQDPDEMFADLMEKGLIEQAEEGASWAVKLLVESLCPPEHAEVPEPEEPLSPAAGQMIYEIIRADRDRD
jgi:hypothetical protein